MKATNIENHSGNIEKHHLEDYNPFSPKLQRKALLEFSSLEKWNLPLAVTLSIRQSRTTPITPQEWKDLGNSPRHFCSTVRESLDQQKCSQNFRHFMNVINAKAYGKKHKLYGKRLAVIPVIEGGRGKRLHYHVAIDCPKHFDPEDFYILIREVWEKTYWGYHEVELVADSNDGWLSYITKLRDKEHYDLSIDWLSYYNHL